MIDFSALESLIIPEGEVTKITNEIGSVLWEKSSAETSNFVLSDGSLLVTSDGLIFNVKEE